MIVPINVTAECFIHSKFEVIADGCKTILMQEQAFSQKKFPKTNLMKEQAFRQKKFPKTNLMKEQAFRQKKVPEN